MLLINDTKSSNKIDCAKECPCGVPVIPVPDQWLEVMVTGGFKVWHIIFIIIAFIVTIIVVYCCFHRCRIPRTKQEIEADLMRTNITNKFRDYLQEFPNEPTTFIEALKKVQELEEKSELEDAQFARESGARKRMGWLKLKGKAGDGKGVGEQTVGSKTGTTDATLVDPNVAPTNSEGAALPVSNEATSQPASSNQHPPVNVKMVKHEQKSLPAGSEQPESQKNKGPPSSSLTTRTIPKAVEAANLTPAEALLDEQTAELTGSAAGEAKLARQARRRKHKPNLSRTKRAKELDVGRSAAYEAAVGVVDATELALKQQDEQIENIIPAAAVAAVPTVRQHVHKVRIEHRERRNNG